VVLFGQTSHAVEPGLPSKTAVMIAAVRAVGSKNPNVADRNPDSFALKFLGPRERAILPDYPAVRVLDLGYDEALRRAPSIGSNVVTQTIRTKFFDGALLAALTDGTRQVVVLGAGFDSRGYRFASRLKGIKFFEVDYGPTQEYKKRRLQGILGKLPDGVTFVPMDFTKDDLLEQLVKAGYSVREKTFFLWEGVVVYLPESAIKDTLHFVRDHSAPDSTIAFDYILASNSNVNNPQSPYAEWGEPWIFGFPDIGAAEFVRREGLEVVSDTPTGWHRCVARVPLH
jgi:methyltransferase (TIGR00027 family)